jgi:hypothetical protein
MASRRMVIVTATMMGGVMTNPCPRSKPVSTIRVDDPLRLPGASGGKARAMPRKSPNASLGGGPSEQLGTPLT